MVKDPEGEHPRLCNHLLKSDEEHRQEDKDNVNMDVLGKYNDDDALSIREACCSAMYEGDEPYSGLEIADNEVLGLAKPTVVSGISSLPKMMFHPLLGEADPPG